MQQQQLLPQQQLARPPHMQGAGVYRGAPPGHVQLQQQQQHGGLAASQHGRAPYPPQQHGARQPPQSPQQQPPAPPPPQTRQQALWADQRARNAAALASKEAEEEPDNCCPLCIEPLDETDASFEPCPCGYTLCLFCYERIKSDLNGLCPSCRTPYDQPELYYEKLEQAKKEAEEAERRKAEKAEANGRAEGAVDAAGDGAAGDGAAPAPGGTGAWTVEGALSALATVASARRDDEAASPSGACAGCGAARGSATAVVQRWYCGHAACRTCAPGLALCPLCSPGGAVARKLQPAAGASPGALARLELSPPPPPPSASPWPPTGGGAQWGGGHWGVPALAADRAA